MVLKFVEIALNFARMFFRIGMWGVFEREVVAFLFECCEDFWTEVVVVDHPMVIWAKSDEVAWGIVVFV
jgi:hypothetical protein